MHNILFFGDSLTAGYGLRNPDTESFPGLIGQKIYEAKLNYKVINAGLSGETSAGGLNRLSYWLNNPVDVLVLELGINDVIRRVPPQTTLNNLQAIIDRLKAKYPSVKIVLMGMQLPAIVTSPSVAAFREIFHTLADKNQLTLVPFFLDGVAGNPRLNLPDQLHPNAEGYKVIADRVWPMLKGLLTEQGANLESPKTITV